MCEVNEERLILVLLNEPDCPVGISRCQLSLIRHRFDDRVAVGHAFVGSVIVLDTQDVHASGWKVQLFQRLSGPKGIFRHLDTTNSVVFTQAQDMRIVLQIEIGRPLKGVPYDRRRDPFKSP